MSRERRIRKVVNERMDALPPDFPQEVREALAYAEINFRVQGGCPPLLTIYTTDDGDLTIPMPVEVFLREDIHDHMRGVLQMTPGATAVEFCFTATPEGGGSFDDNRTLNCIFIKRFQHHQMQAVIDETHSLGDWQIETVLVSEENKNHLKTELDRLVTARMESLPRIFNQTLKDILYSTEMTYRMNGYFLPFAEVLTTEDGRLGTPLPANLRLSNDRREFLRDALVGRPGVTAVHHFFIDSHDGGKSVNCWVMTREQLTMMRANLLDDNSIGDWSIDTTSMEARNLIPAALPDRQTVMQQLSETAPMETRNIIPHVLDALRQMDNATLIVQQGFLRSDEDDPLTIDVSFEQGAAVGGSVGGQDVSPDTALSRTIDVVDASIAGGSEVSVTVVDKIFGNTAFYSFGYVNGRLFTPIQQGLNDIRDLIGE